MAKYLRQRKYVETKSEHLRLAGEVFRTAFIAIHVAALFWFFLIVWLMALYP